MLMPFTLSFHPYFWPHWWINQLCLYPESALAFSTSELSDPGLLIVLCASCRFKKLDGGSLWLVDQTSAFLLLRGLQVTPSRFNWRREHFQCSLDKTLLAFALLHFVLQDQTCLLFQVSLDFLFLHSSPLWWKGYLFFLVLILEFLVGKWSGNPIQYSYWKNSTDRGAWQGYSLWGHKSQTWPSD